MKKQLLLLLAPPYLSDCQLVTEVGHRHFQSADVHTCTVPQTQSRLDWSTDFLVSEKIKKQLLLLLLAPPYLSDCQLVTEVGHRHFRSADVHTFTVHRHSQGSTIEVLGSPDHGYGTICPLNCDSKTFASPSLGGYLRHFRSLRLGAL